jgi:hypothetical protein
VGGVIASSGCVAGAEDVVTGAPELDGWDVAATSAEAGADDVRSVVCCAAATSETRRKIVKAHFEIVIYLFLSSLYVRGPKTRKLLHRQLKYDVNDGSGIHGGSIP